MKFTPENYTIEDIPEKPFIHIGEIWDALNKQVPDQKRVKSIIQKSLDKNRLNMQEVATLINVQDPELIEMIKDGAKTLKENVYGNRIVLFAPLYVGNRCTNNCSYCGFRTSNKEAVRKTLNGTEIQAEVEALEAHGQKRLILVFGEHHQYDAHFIADTVKQVYAIKKGNGEIRRVNINAAPLSKEGFEIVQKAGIGTYQIFQETYHPDAYSWYHLGGRKSDYDNRLISLDRAQEALLDDVGIGALFGLYDWRFEVLAMIRHVNHLEACYNIGPHTISFPRLKESSSGVINPKFAVSDEEFTKLVAIIRLAVPYTGLILTARENAVIRKEVLQYGVSQIDGGTKIELGSYKDAMVREQDLKREQFRIGDNRSLNEVIDELLDGNYLPSFCTACYRKGRTGEHFMEFSVPGFIKRFCSPNAMLTLAEYLSDYATDETKTKGWEAIEKNIAELEKHQSIIQLRNRLNKIKEGQRDIYF